MQITHLLHNTTIAQQTVPAVMKKNIQNGISAKIRRALEEFFRTIVFTAATIPLKLTAKVAQLFGERGKNFSQKLLHTAKKIHALHIHHPILKNRFVDPKILCPMMNIATKKSIRKNEDLQYRQRLLNLIRKPVNLGDLVTLSPSQMSLLKNSLSNESDLIGICLGASICVIKTLLSQNIVSENELVNTLKLFVKGFPGIASALTNLQNPIRDLFKLKAKEELSQQTKKLLINKMEQELFLEWYRKSLTNIDNGPLTIVPLLFELEFIGNGWYLLDKQESEETFNRLDSGYYLIRLKGEKSGHAMVYIKKEFGSYLADPNFGLIKLTNPARDIYQRAQSYGMGEKELGVFSYCLR